MVKWLAPAVGVVVLAVAAGVGAVIWAQGDDAATCNRSALSAVLRDGVARAEQTGQVQFDVSRPPDCSESDLADVLPEVTRVWHMMSGGLIMREPSHTGS